MEEEYCIEYNENPMLQDEVIEYKEVILEEEIHQIQKNKDSKRKEIVIVLPNEHRPVSEVEETNSQREEENFEKSVSAAPN
jgi:hypothetical protein